MSRDNMRSRLLPELLTLLAIPVLTTWVLWLTRVNEVNLTQAILCGLLILLPWQSYCKWRKSTREELPLFAIIAFMYFLYYAVPMFWGELTISTSYGPSVEPAKEVITQALLMAVGGVVFLLMGLKCGLGQRHLPASLTRVELKLSRINYVRFVLIAGGCLTFFDVSPYALGFGGRQAMTIIISMLPLLAFAILFRRFLEDEAEVVDKILIAGFLGVRFLAGMSSGWLGVFTSILIICAALYVAQRKRVPRLALVVVAAFTLFFQVGKDDFRRTYWVEQASSGRIERLQFWIDTSFEKWSDAISNPRAETLREALGPSVNRLSLLTQTANVIEKTPRAVPYQYGRLYSYMLVTFIPRFVWPEKPSVNDANQYYQVAYGLTREEDLGGVSIAVGVLTEGYMNFGWFGAMGIMFLLGIFFDFYQHAFLSKKSGLLLSALGIVLLPQFLGVESQLAQYLGGIVQQILLAMLVMLPAIRLGRSSRIVPVSQLQYANK